MEKPSIRDQQELLSTALNLKNEIHIPRTNISYNIGWIRPRTLEKISLLELESGVEATSQETTRNIKRRAKLLSKAASYFILNGVKIFFFHWIFWRYLYYIKGYTADQLFPIIEIAKKKAQLLKLYQTSILVSHMKITNPTLTQEEAELFQAELLSVLNQPSEKSTDGL